MALKIYPFPDARYGLVEFVFAFVALRLLLGLFGFSFRVFRGFVRFAFCQIPFALNLRVFFALSFVLTQ
jgi:hypothetical protein